jgi:hypothetical protein
MKANELRIGNYISPLGKGITIVEGFCTWDGLIQSSSFAERSIEDFEPIEITKEWLLKLGFEYSEFEDLYQKGGYDVDIIDNVYCHFYINEYGDWYKDIDHVHELQNLYFALTGEELTVEL